MEARAFIAAPLILLLVVYQSLYPIASAQDQIPPAPQFPTQSQPAQSQTQTAVMPTADQLRTFLAPVALYPDQLLAQICTAAGDPQQVLNVDQWLRQQGGLQGQALTDAAQQQNFDPAFIALVNFPQILDMMAQNISSYAAIGLAYQSNQKMVQDVIQQLRNEAYASGALRTNQQQTVKVTSQNNQQVIVITPTNSDVVYVPQYDPQVVFYGPSNGDIVAASLITFGAGIAMGAWMAGSYPWGWGGWGWSWGYPPPPPPFPPRPPHWGPPGPGPGPGPYPRPYPSRPGQGGSGTQFQPQPRPGASGTRPYLGYSQPVNRAWGNLHPGPGAATRQFQMRGMNSFGGGRPGGFRR